MDTVREKATLLVGCVRAALAKGVRHYHPVTKKELMTAEDILTALRDHGSVQFETPRAN
jgi:hypothetical protein